MCAMAHKLPYRKTNVRPARAFWGRFYAADGYQDDPPGGFFKFFAFLVCVVGALLCA